MSTVFLVPVSASENSGAAPEPISRLAGPAGLPGPAAIHAGTGFRFYVNPIRALVRVSPDGDFAYSLETAARLAGVHPDLLRYYCRLGLLGAERIRADAATRFDAESLREIRRIQYYRRHLGVSRRALPLICELRRRAEHLRVAIRFLQGP